MSKNRLKEVREKKNISQSELSRKSDVSQQQISRYEKGLRMTEDSIVKVCKALEVSADYLLGLIDTEEK